MQTADVVIAGAGIIGLSLALDLAQRNLRVVVLERDRAMAEASSAAAGMLAANDPENPPELRQLAHLSLSLYPSYLETIERLSSRKVPLRTQQTLQAVHGDQNFQTLTPAELHRQVPQLNPNHQYVLLAEHSLDPRDLCAALPLAVKAAGVQLREHSPVVSIDVIPIDGVGSQIIVQTPAEPIAANHFVNCAGAWADFPALAIAPNRPLGVHPRKGQMTTVRLRPPHVLNHVLRSPGIYIVPRGDGRLVIGATVEHAGFDKSVEPAAIARLLAAAADLYSPVAHAEILESWAGLRPATPNQLPLIGLLAPSRWLAAGHFRNGILLAPATARVLSQLLRAETPEIDLSLFHPARLPALSTV